MGAYDACWPPDAIPLAAICGQSPLKKLLKWNGIDLPEAARMPEHYATFFASRRLMPGSCSII